MDAILQQKDALQVITISHGERVTEVDEGRSSAVSFREFSALQRLTINHRFFFGIGVEQTAEPSELKRHILQALPPQLELFSVVQCNENHVAGTVPAMETLAYQRDTDHPALQQLNLEIGEDPELAKAHVNARIWFDTGMLKFKLGDK